MITYKYTILMESVKAQTLPFLYFMAYTRLNEQTANYSATHNSSDHYPKTQSITELPTVLLNHLLYY